MFFKFFKKILKHKIFVVISLIVLYLIFVLSMFFGTKVSLEKTYYISQIIEGVFVVGGLIISVLQYLSVSMENKMLKEHEGIVRAAEMANKFQEEIIPLLNIIVTGFANKTMKEKYLQKVENFK